MKKLKTIFCEAFNDLKGTNVHHLDEIHTATFKGRELFNICDIYAGRAEHEYGRKNSRKAFTKGLVLGLVVGLIILIFL
jgi:hypothetical protein